jgi:V/A-type H+-transporting ATPase subunit D
VERASPTRTELLARRAQIRLAETGARLLRGKREALVRELLAAARDLEARRRDMLRGHYDALRALMLSLSVDGPEALRSAAFAAVRAPEAEILERNTWGIRFVELARGYAATGGLAGLSSSPATSARIGDAAAAFARSVEEIATIAPRLHKVQRLSDEIRSVSRRVNALEQKLIPDLARDVTYIGSALDQREREDAFRLRRIKRKLGEGRASPCPEEGG